MEDGRFSAFGLTKSKNLKSVVMDNPRPAKRSEIFEDDSHETV